jgi:hypothetical protein
MRNLKRLSGHPTVPVFQPALGSLEILNSGRALLQISLENAHACLIGQRGFDQLAATTGGTIELASLLFPRPTFPAVLFSTHDFSFLFY